MNHRLHTYDNITSCSSQQVVRSMDSASLPTTASREIRLQDVVFIALERQRDVTPGVRSRG